MGAARNVGGFALMFVDLIRAFGFDSTITTVKLHKFELRLFEVFLGTSDNQIMDKK